MKKLLFLLKRLARILLQFTLFIAIVVLLGWLMTDLPFKPDSAKHHHTENGFRNNSDVESAGESPLAFLKWQLESPRSSWQSAEFEKADNDPAFLKANRSQPTLTWIGHATFLLQFEGVNVLTDPHFSKRTFPVQFAGPKRLVPLGLAFDDLPTVDFVVISHNHYDHLDLLTVKRLHRRDNPVFYVPLGLKSWFAAEGIDNVVELDWWETSGFSLEQRPAWQVTAVPGQHFSSRTPWDRNHTLWAGWILEAAGRKFYFAGDTGYSDDFKAIGERYAPIDLAMIPIGAYEPRWFMKAMHVNPEEAVRIHQDIGARFSVGMHWGTFRLTDEPLAEPPQALKTAMQHFSLPAEQFVVMQHGETMRLDQQPQR